VRISTVADAEPATFAALRSFAAELIRAVPRTDRPVLIGHSLGNRIPRA